MCFNSFSMYMIQVINIIVLSLQESVRSWSHSTSLIETELELAGDFSTLQGKVMSTPPRKWKSHFVPWSVSAIVFTFMFLKLEAACVNRTREQLHNEKPLSFRLIMLTLPVVFLINCDICTMANVYTLAFVFQRLLVYFWYVWQCVLMPLSFQSSPLAQLYAGEKG